MQTANQTTTLETPVHLRTAKSSDASALSALWRRSIRQTCGPYYGNDERILGPWADGKTPECTARLIETEEWFLLAETRDKTIAGFVCGTFALCSFALYVDPSYQRRGIGTRLFRCWERIAIECGIPKLVFHASRNAVEFYRKHGCSATGPESGETCPAIPMSKALSLEQRIKS